MKNILFIGALALSCHALADSVDGYRDTACYKEYEQEYKKASERAHADFKRRQELAYKTGLVMEGRSRNTDAGKSEKSIMNAADLLPQFNERGVSSRYTLNDFGYIHKQVLHKFPQAAPETTQYFIREGFKSEKFCSKFLFISSRYDKEKVAEYVLERFEQTYDAKAIQAANVNDSEMEKEGDQSSGSGKAKASGAQARGH